MPSSSPAPASAGSSWNWTTSEHDAAQIEAAIVKPGKTRTRRIVARTAALDLCDDGAWRTTPDRAARRSQARARQRSPTARSRPWPAASSTRPRSRTISRISGSIDELLAETDQGWDIDAQVLTLKQAAAVGPSHEPSWPAAMRPPAPSRSVAIPTPYELAPSTVARSSIGSVEISPPPSLTPRSRVPSKAPPPLPRKPPPSLPPSANRSPGPSPVRVPADMAQADALIDLLNARVTTLESRDDKVSLSRAHIELAIASEAILGDDGRATVHAEAALKVMPTSAAAHAMLRRRQHSRASLPAMLEHLEHELLAATSEAHKVELFAEKARLLEAIGDRSNEVRATWGQALIHAPDHAAALKGLEVELFARAHNSSAPGDFDALAVHLGRMADAYGSEKRLAAWLHVERATILERRLGRLDAARGALERALELDPERGSGARRPRTARRRARRLGLAREALGTRGEHRVERRPRRAPRARRGGHLREPPGRHRARLRAAHAGRGALAHHAAGRPARARRARSHPRARGALERGRPRAPRPPALHHRPRVDRLGAARARLRRREGRRSRRRHRRRAARARRRRQRSHARRDARPPLRRDGQARPAHRHLAAGGRPHRGRAAPLEGPRPRRADLRRHRAPRRRRAAPALGLDRGPRRGGGPRLARAPARPRALGERRRRRALAGRALRPGRRAGARRRAQARVPREGRDALGGAAWATPPAPRARTSRSWRSTPTAVAPSWVSSAPRRGSATRASCPGPCSTRPASRPTAGRSSRCAPGPRRRS